MKIGTRVRTIFTARPIDGVVAGPVTIAPRWWPPAVWVRTTERLIPAYEHELERIDDENERRLLAARTVR